MDRLAEFLNQAIGSCLKWCAVLVLPIIGLLFAQWPLRDLVQFGSREANDAGQCLFALYIACSMTAASRSNQHLRSELLAGRFGSRLQNIMRAIGLSCGVLPWACYGLVTSVSSVIRSVAQMEHFADTGNPGYFIIKSALLLMLALMALQALADLLISKSPETTSR